MHPHGFHSPPPHPPPGWGGGHHPSHHGHHHHPPQGPPPSVGEFLPHHRHYQPPPGPPPPSLREQSPHHRHYQPPPGPPPPSVREHSPAHGQYQPPPGPPPPSVGGYPSRPTTHPTPPHRPQSLPPQPHRVNTLPPTSTPPVPVRHSPVPPQSSPAPSYHMRSHPPPYASLPPTPPQSPQSFGHGAPSSYQFQYSNCSGKRKALLIGINYFGQANQLKGCINDVTQMSTFLNQVYGYRREDMVILTDDQQNPLSQPTKANIIRAMHWLVKDAMPNDSLFVHFSGHGGRTPDLDGDEDDGFDDVIYPVDYKNAGHIVDDDMHDIMVKPLQPGVRLTAIFDSCHSGTALDLPFIYSTQGVLKEPNLAKEAAQDLFSAFSAYGKGDISGVAQTAIGFFKKATIGGSARERRMMTKTSPADVVMFSGSKDTQTSADTFQGGQARGALSWAFIETLKQYPKQSYLQLLNNIRAKLERNYSQKPQLSCSHPLGL